MGLDVLTPRGLQTVRDEDAAAALWESHNPSLQYSRTPKDTIAAVDAVITHRDGFVRAVAECKCRYGVTEDSFRTAFKNEWLVTMDKLVKGADAAKMLCVPYYGFLYLVDCGTLMTIKIADSKGQFCVQFRCDNTQTRKTVNGGDAVRANAYIDMTSSRVFRGQPWNSTSSLGCSGTKAMTMTSVALDPSVQRENGG